MKCETVRDNLSAFLDHELEPLLRSEIETHLAQCDECAVLLDQLARTVRLVESLPRVNAPDDVLAEVRDRLARQTLLGEIRRPVSRVHRLRFIHVAGSLAAAAVVLVVAYLVFFTPPALRTSEQTPKSPARVAESSELGRSVGLAPTDNIYRAKGDTSYAKGSSGNTYYFTQTQAVPVRQTQFVVTVDGPDQVHIVLAVADPTQARQAVQQTLAELGLSNGENLAFEANADTDASRLRSVGELKDGKSASSTPNAKLSGVRGETRETYKRTEEEATQSDETQPAQAPQTEIAGGHVAAKEAATPAAKGQRQVPADQSAKVAQANEGAVGSSPASTQTLALAEETPPLVLTVGSKDLFALLQRLDENIRTSQLSPGVGALDSLAQSEVPDGRKQRKESTPASPSAVSGAGVQAARQAADKAIPPAEGKPVRVIISIQQSLPEPPSQNPVK